MAAEATFNENDEKFPITIEIKGERLFFTKKGAIEFKNKLQLAIDEMLEYEANEA